MGYPVTLIRGSGKDAVVADAAQTAIDATGVSIDWQVLDLNDEILSSDVTPLSNYLVNGIRKTRTALKGPLTLASGQDPQIIDALIQDKLALYANLRPARSVLSGPFQNLDLVIVRENTEDIYAGIEFERTSVEAADARSFLSKLSGKRIREDSAVGIKPISVKGSGQIVEFAFNYARLNQRHKVTAVHLANVMMSSDGLFLEIAHEIAKEFPDIQFEDRAVSLLLMELIQDPQAFDVLVMPNSYGDLLSHLCVGMMGELGAPSAYIGDQYAVFDVLSPPVVPLSENPTTLILSGVLMLQHLGERDAARNLQTAVESVMTAQTSFTSDKVPGIEPECFRGVAQAIAQALC
ncbi:isocitrate/isopropylmalate family dehydrogenase [Acaryochloris sp. IP29b_bin.137]|uniref:isocitrate/isopropylmalate family dehydrogenase n=1 Tax=Acaryochloris sp. IP29b_bin.137 TaxID=2969217 RepID=UPI0026161C08|nr:isocitrate/isopropylmalate family dehydrogenase [Acaryochloris sp. IP29b_bin.137]